ncbi:MAG: tetraspanin family protein [Prevotella sp.]|nr:tetraspanin family protein [Prevotella sp.]
MDKIWDTTMDFLAKINTWIPLVAVLWAGIGLLGIVLILAVTGCFLRKRLVPQWLLWTYFAFAAVVIFAQAEGNIFTVVANLELPFLVVLLCYILRLLFYRRPRYRYVKETVYAREIAKGRAVVEEDATTTADVVETTTEEEQDGIEIQDERAVSKKEQRQAAKAAKIAAREQEKAEREAAIAAEKAAKEQAEAEREAALAAEREARIAQRAADEQAAREAEERAKVEQEKAAAERAAARASEKAAREAEAAKKAAAERAEAMREAEAAKRQAALEKEAAEKAAREAAAAKAAAERAKAAAERAKAEQKAAETAGIDLPVVEPIPDKTYEPMREPTIVATPVSETMPNLKIPNTTIRLSNQTTSRTYTPRPVTTTSNASRTLNATSITTRPTTTTTTTVSPNRTVTTETTTTPLNAYTSMYNPRVVKTTTTTTTTTTNTNTNTLNAVSATRTVNGNTTGTASIKATSTNGTLPNSTKDIMSAIERLRLSMKK